MPFLKLGENRYRGPSGKIFTEAQVRYYYANGGSFPDKPKKGTSRSKREK